MNLGGIPPLSGFIGKLGLLQAGAQQGGPLVWTVVGAGVVTSLLTLYAIAKVWGKAFWRPVEQAPQQEPSPADHATSGALLIDQRTGTLPRTMVAATIGLVAVSLSLTVVAGPLYGYAERAATDLLARTPYVTAALPGPA
jgi:multicomponent Na+:H+ antiporter subunit D